MIALVKLDPRWCIGSYWETTDNPLVKGGRQMAVIIGRHGMGLSFLCPVHRDHRLVVMFANPIDGGQPADAHFRWQRSGESFETLTLGPSIDASGGQHGNTIRTPCWHGFIVNGEVGGVVSQEK